MILVRTMKGTGLKINNSSGSFKSLSFANHCHSPFLLGVPAGVVQWLMLP